MRRESQGFSTIPTYNQIKKNRERVTGKEQFYTNAAVVTLCLSLLIPYIKPHHTLLEPCAGDGAFVDGIAMKFSNPIYAYDLHPGRPDIDILDASAADFRHLCGDNLFTITNLPFGRANSLSVKIFNNLAKYSDFIGTIVPKSWQKWSIQNRLSTRFHLQLQQDLPLNSFHYPDGSLCQGGALHTVFQLWEKKDTERQIIEVEDRGYFKKVSPNDADVAFTAFGYSTGRVEREFVRQPNTCKLFLKVSNPRVIDALEQVDVSRFSSLAAYTPVISMEELRFLLNEYFDEKSA